MICIIREIKDEHHNLENQIKRQIEDPQNLEIYNLLKGKLNSEDIQAIISVKTSYRPDRRYQPLFEAAIIKSISYVLSQSWQYYMISNELSQADINLFQTAISPHGLILGQDIKLIDKTFLLFTPQDLRQLIAKVVEHYNNSLS